MVLFGMMLMNGFWPVAVWRAGHERSTGLVEMMSTTGLRPYIYLLGMFAFDMLVSLTAGVGLVGFAVGLQLLSFKDAPYGWLIAIVLLSAYALNAATMLLTLLAGSRASILSLFAACAVFSSAAASALLSLLLYPDDGDWPPALNLVPFLAQGRSLYIVLVYHKSSKEVTDALLILFAFGSAAVLCSLLWAESDAFVPCLAKLLGKSPESAAGSGSGSGAKAGAGAGVVAAGRVIDAGDGEDVDGGVEGEALMLSGHRGELDADLGREKALAAEYVLLQRQRQRQRQNQPSRRCPLPLLPSPSSPLPVSLLSGTLPWWYRSSS
mmetsp:Transcript_21930/g.49624  ORF Transcript_21930/g.49624 Transcript_21930/m.49624 type:complete len:323 (-) Transcript_21930:877-1845(-)